MEKTDLFTLIVEIDSAIHSSGLSLDSKRVGPALEQFYLEVDALFTSTEGTESNAAKLDATVFRYLKAATKATNDRYARVDRAEVISALIAQNASVSPPRPKTAVKPHSRKRK